MCDCSKYLYISIGIACLSAMFFVWLGWITRDLKDKHW